MQTLSTRQSTTNGSISRLLTTEETAKILGVKPSTLGYWRCTGRYALPYVKSGRLCRYRPEDVAAFIENRRVGG